MIELKKRVRGDSLSLGWLECWNPESSILIHESCRDSVIKKIKSTYEIMDEGMVKEMRNWDMQEMLDSEKFSVMHQNFVSRIN